MIALCTVLCGGETCADMALFGRSKRDFLQEFLTLPHGILSHDTFSVQMIDTKEQLRSFVKADLREHGFIASPMPSYRDTLSPQETADIVSYLSALKTR